MTASPYDAPWLLSVRDRRSRGDAWEDAIRTFLAHVRGAACSQVRWRARLRGRSPQPADLDDILALADARFIQTGIDRFEGRSSPTTYYLAIVATSTVSYFRPPWRRREAASALSGDLVAAPEELSSVERRELWRDLQAALCRAYAIKPEWAQAVDLFLFQQVGSAAECAGRVGISEANFNQRITRGRQLLQGLLLEGGYHFLRRQR